MPRVLCQQIWLLASCIAFAARLGAAPQAADQPPAFDVVSIKPNRNCSSRGIRPVMTPGRVEVSCINARGLILAGYGAFTGSEMSTRLPDVVGGPAWINTD